MDTKNKQGFTTLYDRFVQMLRRYAVGSLKLRENPPGNCELVGPPVALSRGREVWFGAARIGKNYVSYHLMPVYAFPDLLEGMSPGLKKRMQGKSCFNFTHLDETLFQELAELTERGYKRFKEQGLIE
jgi:hypothetical protein